MSTMPPVFSPDGRYLFYVLQDYKGGRSMAFVSDTETGEMTHTAAYDNINPASISPDGWRLAYSARKGEQYFVVVSTFAGGGVIEKEIPGYAVGGIVFSPDSSRIAYVEAIDDKKHVVVYNLQINARNESQPHDNIAAIRFAEDSRSVSYSAVSGDGPAWKTLEAE